MNSVILSGRLTKKPELKTTTTGTDICTFSLAVNRYASEQADFIECVCFGKTAVNLAKYQDKGNMLEINGKIQNNNYTDKAGKTVYKTTIVADMVNYISTGQKAVKQAENSEINPYQAMGSKVSADNLPF